MPNPTNHLFLSRNKVAIMRAEDEEVEQVAEGAMNMSDIPEVE